MTRHLILMCILLTHLWDDNFIEIFGVAGQNVDTNIVNPNPAAIGSQMTVTCSTDSIGGLGQLGNLSSYRSIETITMSRQVAKVDKATWMAEYVADVKFEFSTSNNQPLGINKTNYKFEGRGVGPYFNNNVNTMRLTLTVPKVSCELIGAYICELQYYTPNYRLEKRSFQENVTNIIAVSKVFMTAYQSHYHYGSYSVGERILFTCKINGTQNMTMEWEAAQCSAPNVYNKLSQKDQNFVIRDNSKDLTQTKCNDPVREYSIELDYETTKTYCSIRCVAYDKDGKKIENYHQSLDQNIVNGTKSVATKKPVPYWGHFAILCVCAASVIFPVAICWRYRRKYKLCVMVYDDSTVSMTTHNVVIN